MGGFNLSTGKFVYEGERGTTLGELKSIASSLERIADSLEKLVNEENSKRN